MEEQTFLKRTKMDNSDFENKNRFSLKFFSAAKQKTFEREKTRKKKACRKTPLKNVAGFRNIGRTTLY
jgi:hypothetical protein